MTDDEHGLTAEQAFTAMHFYLQRFYIATKGEGGVRDLVTPDPADWENWLEAVRKAKHGEALGRFPLIPEDEEAYRRTVPETDQGDVS